MPLNRIKLNWNDVKSEERFQYDDIKNSTTKEVIEPLKEVIEPLAKIIIEKLKIILDKLSKGNNFSYKEAKNRSEHLFWDNTVVDVIHMEYFDNLNRGR